MVSGEWCVVSSMGLNGSHVTYNTHHLPLTTHAPTQAVSFLLHFPGPSATRDRLERWALPTTVPCGARTFLSPRATHDGQRPSGQPANEPSLYHGLRTSFILAEA